MPGSNSNPDSIWLYNPSLALSIVFAVIYTVPLVLQTWQTFFKYKSYYFSVVIIGAAFEVGGYVSRAVSIQQQEDIPPYAVSSSLIVLAPLFVAAGNYLLLTRLCTRVLPASGPTHIFRIPLKHLTKIFVTSDIFTFLIQVSGSGIASSNDWEGDTVEIGEDVLIAGLAVQLASLVVFLVVLFRFQVLARDVQRADAGHGWRIVVRSIWISSSLIIVRSIYRLIEFALGIFGYPFTHEWMFYVFESVPMVPAILVFCVWHPAGYFGGRRGEDGGKGCEETGEREGGVEMVDGGGMGSGRGDKVAV